MIRLSWADGLHVFRSQISCVSPSLSMHTGGAHLCHTEQDEKGRNASQQHEDEDAAQVSELVLAVHTLQSATPAQCQARKEAARLAWSNLVEWPEQC